MSRTYRYSGDQPEYSTKYTRRAQRSSQRDLEKPFRCTHCKAMVGLVPFGGKHRNHCPYCLHSRHVDGKTPGDRANDCRGAMKPVGAFVRSNGEHAIVHRCLACGFERHNRIAADDYFEVVLALPLVQPRTSARAAENGRDALSA